jgi:hypothetical protein
MLQNVQRQFVQGFEPLLCQRLFDEHEMPHGLARFRHVTQQTVQLLEHQGYFKLFLLSGQFGPAGQTLATWATLFQHDLDTTGLATQGHVVLEEGHGRLAQRAEKTHG